jgi:DNA (cytosine-5)-methyltransferase 1
MSHVDSTPPVTHVSLCAGYGGIDLGLHRAIRNLRTIAVSEIEAFACANLVAKMEAGLLDCAPIWTDLKTFPWSDFRDRVDILSGGYPCQPFSAAGKRLGAEDPRHLWPFISAGIAAMRPAVCFFENVEGHISLGLRDVLQDLVGLGYRATWCVASASECGAPHQRKRVFILAHAQQPTDRSQAAWHEIIRTHPGGPSSWSGGSSGELAFTSSLGSAAGFPRPQQGHEGIAGVADDCGDEGLANAECGRLTAGRNNARQSQRSQPEHCCAWPSRPGEQQFAWEPPRVVADSKKSGRISERIAGDMDGETSPEGSRGHQLAPTIADCGDAGAAEAVGNATQRQDHGREPGDLGTAPSQGRCGDHAADGAGETVGNAEELRRTGLCQDAAADLDEQLVESANASGRQTQPPLGRDADGPAHWLDHAELYVTCDNRTDELRLLGNGVVPACAERAFRLLVGELMEHQP